MPRIKTLLEKQKDFLRDTYQVDDLGVFGSVARGENKEVSDIDILVKFVKPVGMFKFIELEEYLTKLFGKKVDLVTTRALKPAIKNEVLQEVIYV